LPIQKSSMHTWVADNCQRSGFKPSISKGSDHSIGINICFSLFNFSHFLHFTVGFSFKLLFENSEFVTFWLYPARVQAMA
jgi:hypothetical protein